MSETEETTETGYTEPEEETPEAEPEAEPPARGTFGWLRKR